MDKERIQKIILICTSTITVTALHYHLIMSDMQLNAIRELKKKIGDQQTRIAEYDDNQKKRNRLAVFAVDVEPFLKQHEVNLVQGDQIAWFWREMGDFAAREKVTRLAVTPDGVGPDGLADNLAYGRASASVTLNCGYHKLGEFVQNLENTYGTMQIREIEILGGTTSDPAIHTVRMKLQLLALPEEKDKDAGEDPKYAQVHEE